MNKPLIKNAISYGIPTIISAIGIIMALDKLKKYMETGGAEYGKLEKGV